MDVAVARRVIGVVTTLVAAVALAWAVAGRGCGHDADAPEAAVRAFVDAARAGDEAAVWALLAPVTRAHLEEAASAAADKAGAARRFAPLDVLDVAPSETSYTPATIVARDQTADHALVDILGPGGKRDVVEVVRVDGHWRVVLP